MNKRDYEEALLSQSACNLSGIVFSFASIMGKICDEAYSKGYGTDWKNNHPICRLFAAQISHLSKGLDYSQAFEECQKQVYGKEKEEE